MLQNPLLPYLPAKHMPFFLDPCSLVVLGSARVYETMGAWARNSFHATVDSCYPCWGQTPLVVRLF